MPARKRRNVLELALPARTARPPLAAEQDYGIEEAAVLLCTSRSTLYEMIRRGECKVKKRGRRSRISGAEIIRLNAIEQTP